MMDSTCADKMKEIIGKYKSNYWVRTHKFGAKITKYVADGESFDENNVNTLWWDAICK